MLSPFKKKFISVFLCLILPFYGTAVSRAESPGPLHIEVSTPDNEPDPGEAISPMRKGNRAPFTGVLLSPRAMAKILVDIKTAQERVAIEVDKAKAECEANCDKKASDKAASCEADKKIAEATIEQNIKEIQSLNKELKDLRDDQPNVYLWTGLGVLAGIGVSVLAVYAVSQAAK